MRKKKRMDNPILVQEKIVILLYNQSSEFDHICGFLNCD